MLKLNACKQPLPDSGLELNCSDKIVNMENQKSGGIDMADDNIARLSRIEAGQGYICQSMKDLQQSMKDLQLALLKVSAQEEKQIQLRIEVDVLWKKIDKVWEYQNKCPIDNLKTQVGWIWVFLSSLALGLTMLFITRITPG
jgi:hypothetical protein